MPVIGICGFYEMVVNIQKATGDKMRVSPPHGMSFGAISEGFALAMAQKLQTWRRPRDRVLQEF